LKDITKASIGVSGGSLKTESFSITIPAGAFINKEDQAGIRAFGYQYRGSEAAGIH